MLISLHETAFRATTAPHWRIKGSKQSWIVESDETRPPGLDSQNDDIRAKWTNPHDHSVFIYSSFMIMMILPVTGR
jgi:hypothetical protein